MRAFFALVAVTLGAFAPAVLAPAAPARAAVTFDSSLYYPIDVAREARDEYGPSATAVSVSDHIYGWRASVNGRLYSLDLKRAVATQYGSGWSLVAVGVHRYDWRAIAFSRLTDTVLPVMEIASDQIWNTSGVDTGLARWRSVLVTTQNWYAYRTGETFSLLQPVVLATDYTSQQWNDISDSTNVECDQNYCDPNRWNLINAVHDQYTERLPSPGSSLAVAAAPYTGDSASVWLGAADSARFAIAAPRATSVTCAATGAQDANCADATYAIGHELGHAFGLKHSCDAYPWEPACHSSIMQTGKPWDAILLREEVSSLRASPYFS